MTPYHQNERESQFSQSSQPTSPWTEAFQDAPAQSHHADDAAPAFEHEVQPTRDALSSIYNRGYAG